MIAKYITAENREAAEAKASALFACDRGALTIDVISAGQEDNGPCEILAIKGTHPETDNMNAAYGLYYEEDGVYLELYARRGNGAEFETNTLTHHLSRKRIADLSLSSVRSLIDKGSGRSKIAMAQKEYVYGEDLSIKVAGDEQEASAILLAPEPNGPAIEPDAIKAKFAEAGIIHGIDEEALTGFINKKDYGEPYVVAKATPPANGEDGKLIFHFSTDERTGSPREIGGGRVDYRSLDLYVPVTEGQLLVTKKPATEGSPGMTVKGKGIKQRPGKEVALPRGKNVEINDEKTEMKASCSGMVEFVKNVVNVSSVYKINGDCDMSVGSIDFEGSIHISGSVRSGNTIKATDGISIGGGVEAAVIIAGGNVEIKGGMQGSSKGSVEAGGSVSIMYIERGLIVAEGPVTVDVSIHSKIETGSTVHAQGKRGAIIGGRVEAAGDIVTNFIGALSNTKTEIEVGLMPKKRARILALEKELERLDNDKLKLDQLETYLEKTKETMDPETWDKLHRSGVENRRINEEDMGAYSAEIALLRDELSHSTESRVHVFDTAFAGSRITIGSSALKITEDTTYATFRYSDGEVVYGPCELDKGDIKK